MHVRRLPTRTHTRTRPPPPSSPPLHSFALYEPVEFIRHFLADKLEWTKVRDSVSVHVPCSSKKMGVASAFEELAGRCAHEVTPSGIPCCGACAV